MAHKLPDEILREILSPVLKVNDFEFADTAPRSPFSLRSYSTSAILVVCKRWLRIATPLLYHVVILRSTAQAQALALALKLNRGLGLFIKKLRVEGGFGASLHKIVLAAPNITDLFLTLMIWSSDSVSGLCRALPTMNPTRVILQDNGRENNVKVRQLIVKLCEGIEAWSNMKTFDFPYYASFQDRSALIIQALTKAPNLHTLFIPSPPWSVPGYFNTIIDNPSLKVIHVKSGVPSSNFLSSIACNPRLRALVTFPEQEIPASLRICPQTQVNLPGPPSNPFFVPMAAVPVEVQEKIWSRAFEFLLGPLIPEGLESLGYKDKDTRRALPLVSKIFNRLSIPLLYRHPVIIRHRTIELFADRLVLNPALGLHVRTLYVTHLGKSTAVAQNMYKILSRTPSLVRLYTTPTTNLAYSQIPTLSWDGFVALGQTAGPTLREFHDFQVTSSAPLHSSSVFNRFTSLRSLRWCSAVRFRIDQDSVTSTCFYYLETIHFTHCDQSFFDVLSHMELPSLSRVYFGEVGSNVLTFFSKHGAKIRNLEIPSYGDLPVLDLCPALTLLTIRWAYVVSLNTCFRCNIEHRSLTKIVIKTPTYRRVRQPWSNFFESLELAPFRALTEIQVQSCTWPTTERDVAKDSWHEWAERLLESNVKLTDRDGRAWRPRLKNARHS